jgi:ribosomal protein L13E
MKQNKLKINTRLEEERRQRQASEERQRKKREQMELNNQMVRCVNKEKTYKYQQRGPLGEQQAA